jgi:hypothetical protein
LVVSDENAIRALLSLVIANGGMQLQADADDAAMEMRGCLGTIAYERAF